MSGKICLIISVAEDFSTNEVISWLRYLNKPFIRINCGSDKLLITNIKIGNGAYEFSFRVNDRHFAISDVASVWYRRGSILQSLSIELDSGVYKDQFYLPYLKEEMRDLALHLLQNFNKVKELNSLTNAKLNKLVVLELAQSLGIAVPATLVTTDKPELQAFMAQHGSIITKSISDALNYNLEGAYFLKTFTEIVDSDFVATLPDQFFPSLFQERIDKNFEVRVFYLEGRFSSMAIFSQADEKTKVDFRNYNRSRPNRTIPYIIPKKLENNLLSLFKALDLNSGSVDFAVDKNLNHVFFEINPVGQFGMVSGPCRYFLEKRIAEFL